MQTNSPVDAYYSRVLPRVVADALLVTLSLALGLTIPLIRSMTDAGSSLDGAVIHDWWRRMAAGAPLLVLVSILTFHLFGFYTYGRTYRGRYKLPLIVGAVAASFAIFAGAIHVLEIGDRPMSSSAVLWAWGIATALVVSARLWSTMWIRIKQMDAAVLGDEPPAIDRVERVLVVGGAGYIGSAMTRQLLEQGFRVRVLDRFLFGKEPLADVLGRENLELMEGDFREIEVVLDAMRDVDTVIHLGAIVGDPACSFDEELTIDVNLAATRTVADAARACGVRRFVFASTCSVYGASSELLDEQSPVNPLSLYARTKLACERGLLELASPRFSVSIARLGTIYGVSGRVRFDLVVNVLTARAKQDGVIPIHGGDQWRPFVHVEDAARGIVAIARGPIEITNGETFNVGSDEQNYTILEVGEIIRERVPCELLVNGADFDRRDYRVSFRKISRMLGFRPKWTLLDGIDQILKTLACGQVDDYRHPRHDNNRFLREYAAAKLSEVRTRFFDREVEALRANARRDVGAAASNVSGEGTSENAPIGRHDRVEVRP